MKNISTLSFIVLTNICSVATTYSQSSIGDDFDDGNFTSSAEWTGNGDQFIVNASHQLQLNATTAGTSWLSTAFDSPRDEDLEWELYVKQAFAGSGNNYGRVYLLSNRLNPNETTAGYYLQLGEAGSNDAIELFRQSGTSVSSVCRSANASISSSFAVRIKVKKSAGGQWELLIDYDGGTAYSSVATGTDNTYNSGSYFGIVCVYTAGNASKFYFDDIHAGVPHVDPPLPDPASPSDVIINEFFSDPSPSVGLPAQEFVEIYNRSTKTFDLNGWKLGDATSLGTLPSYSLTPGAFVVITNSSGLPDYQQFGNAISLSAFPSLNNGGDAIRLLDQNGIRIDSLNYTLSWFHVDSLNSGGYTIERLNPDRESDDINNWFVSLSENGGTPGKINSVFGRNPDSQSPSIIEMRVNGLQHIVIRFSEQMNSTDAENVASYQLTGNGMIDGVSYDTTAFETTLTLIDVVNGTDYSILISGQHDVAGNILAPQKFQFTPFEPHEIHAKDIVITEFMADPSPTVQLPDAEYIELLNRSGFAVNLGQWQVTDGSSRAILPSIILLPQQYLIVTSATNVSKFNNITRVVGVTGFPSLGNSADHIVLLNKELTPVDSISYDLTWYRNVEKSEGGWSLEIIDPNNICGEEGNWVSSGGDSGGTPGTVNSVNANMPDVIAPVVLDVTLISADTILIKFNERLNDVSLSADIRILQNEVAGTLKFEDHKHRSLLLLLAKPLPFGTPYNVSISGVADCAGNYVESETFQCFLPEEASWNDVIINELLFNPRAEQADFVELYNRSSKYIDLRNWSTNGKALTQSADIFHPHTYRIYTSSIVSVQSNYPRSVVESMKELPMPSLPDDEGTIDVRDGHGNPIDVFSYTDDMHSAILRDTEGVSLERISFDTHTDDPNNWHSANGSEGFATPGFVNSVARPSGPLDDAAITVAPEVIAKSGAGSFTQLKYRFAETGLVANVRVVDLEGRTIKIIASNETIGAEGSFHWDGDRAGGGRAGAGYYLIWFEVFDPGGKVTTYRNRVVVAM